MWYLYKEKQILELFDHPTIPKVIDFKEGKQIVRLQY